MIGASTAMGPEETQAVLGAALREVRGPDARIAGWVEEPISRNGKHRVVRFDVQAVIAGCSSQVLHRWVGKFYGRDEEPRGIAAIVRALAASGNARRGGLIVPRVVTYYPPCRLLISVYEGGVSLVSAIDHHDGRVLPAVARALAALHAVPIARDRVASPAALLDELGQRNAMLCARFPHEAVRLRRLLERQQRSAPPLPPSASFLHGDLAPAELLWREGALVLLDFDQCTRGDPALDLGTLLAQLRRVSLRTPDKLADLATMRGQILDAYQQSSRRDPGLAGRVAWYELTALLRKLHALAFDGARRPGAEALARRQAEAVHLLQCLDTIDSELDSIRSC